MASRSEILATIEAYAGDVPPAFLQALALRESSLDPLAVNAGSSAAGLFQITTPVLKDWNRAMRAEHTRADLFDPELATRVASFHIRRIVALWREIPGLTESFDDRRFVELLVLGWNAGPSAVAKLARRLGDIGLPAERISADAVHEAAVATAPGSFVAIPERLAFAKLVATTFEDARSGRDRPVASARPRGARELTHPGARSSGMGGLAPALAAAVGVGAVIAATAGASDDAGDDLSASTDEMHGAAAAEDEP